MKGLKVSELFTSCLYVLLCATSRFALIRNKGGKFLEKLWGCVGGRASQSNLVLSTELIT